MIGSYRELQVSTDLPDHVRVALRRAISVLSAAATLQDAATGSADFRLVRWKYQVHNAFALVLGDNWFLSFLWRDGIAYELKLEHRSVVDP